MNEEPENQCVSNARYLWLVTGKTVLGLASAAFYILGAFMLYMTVVWMFMVPRYGLICDLAVVFLITIAFFLFRAAKSIKTEMAIVSDSEKPRKRVVSKGWGWYALLIAPRIILAAAAIQLFVICGLSSILFISSISSGSSSVVVYSISRRMIGFAAPSLGVALTTLLLGLCLIKIEHKLGHVTSAIR